MRNIIYLTITALLIMSCTSPDPREADFSLDYDKLHQPYTIKFFEGEITNISSNPADEVTLKIDKYTQLGIWASSERVKIKDGLDPNQTKEFCALLADSIARIKVRIVKVE